VGAYVQPGRVTFMRVWLPTVIFLTALAAPIVVAAYVLFGVNFTGGTSALYFSAGNRATLVLCVLVGIMMSFVFASIVTSIVLRFRRAKPAPADTRPVHTSVLAKRRENQEKVPDYVRR
jgi:hypothetical protein